MKWPLLVLFISISMGLVSFNNVISFRFLFINVYGNDLIFYAVIIYAFFQIIFWRKSQRIFDLDNKLITLYALVVLFSILWEFQQTSQGWGSLQYLIRILPFYLTYFILPAFIKSDKDLMRVLTIFIFVSTIGNFVIILQSLKGPGVLFDRSVISQILMKPGPQIISNYGSFFRSNFQIYFACVWSFFFCLAALIIKKKIIHLIGVIFFSFSFILNMSRGLYFGIFLALVIFFVLVSIMSRKFAVQYIFILAIIIMFVLLVTPLIGFNSIGSIILDRINTGLNDFQGNSGTWNARLVQLEMYLSLKPDIINLLFGYGYSGGKSGLSNLPFIEFGLVDPIYRVGIIGSLFLLISIFSLLVESIKGAIRNANNNLVLICLALLCSLISELGQLISADHFLYHYYGAVIGLSAALYLTGTLYLSSKQNTIY
jgi:hypothetical protein